MIDIGVEIHLGMYAISDTGTMHIRGNQPYMIFEDTEDDYMASVEFGNTWWDSVYTTGKELQNRSLYCSVKNLIYFPLCTFFPF